MQWGDLKWQRRLGIEEAFAIVQLKGNIHLDIRPNGDDLFSMWIESGSEPKHSSAGGAIEWYYNVEPIEACCLFYELLAKYGLPE